MGKHQSEKLMKPKPYICFKDKSLLDGIIFLELLSSVQPRAVNWGLVTKGVTDEQGRP